MQAANQGTTKRVLIIGGGLAGPCLALALARHNIRSTIFEIRPTRSDSGGSISLGPNGLRVLDKHAGIYDRLCKIGYPYNYLSAYSDDGECFGRIKTGEQDSAGQGYPALRVMRPELHKALLERVEEKGRDLINVKYNAKLTRIDEKVDSVTVHFEDGSQETGTILIGADGIHSKVRDYVLGDEAVKATFAKLFIVSGFVSSKEIEKPVNATSFELPAFVFTPAGFMMVIPIDAEGKTLAYGLNKNTDVDRTREGWAELEASGEASRAAKADYDGITTQPVRSILDKSEDKNARIWAPYHIPDIPKWHTKRVCLIGDAAHGMPPNGLGSGLAFEDAALLTRLLSTANSNATVEKEIDYDILFDRFEKLRRIRIAPIRKAKVADGFRSQTGPWVWYLKKWAFRAFFWWKGGELEHVTAYNVDEIEI